MADINALYARRDSINSQLATLQAKKSNLEKQYKSAFDEVNSLRKQAQRQLAGGDEAGAQFLFGLLDQAQAKQDAIGEQILQIDAERRALEQELAQVNAEISTAQQAAALPKQSTGQTVREDQAANADRADIQRPSPPPVVAGADGRVITASSASETNAQRPVTQQDAQGQDLGTNAQPRSIDSLMGLPQKVAAPGPLQPSQGGAKPGQIPGAAAANDNQTNATRAEINTLFGGSRARIVTQPNVLDKYTSYSYNISIYIMSPADYARLIRTKQRVLNGFQLLMQSGGAPLSSGFQGQDVGGDTGEVPGNGDC